MSLALLVEADFEEGASRFWLNGPSSITVDGLEWTGVGALVAVSPIEPPTGDAAAKMTFTLSGVDPALVALAQASGSVRGRRVTIYGQFRDPETRELLDDRFIIPAADRMDKLSYVAKGPQSRSITLTAETVFTARSRARYAFYSDNDQQARFAGDRGMSFVPGLKTKITHWPRYD